MKIRYCPRKKNGGLTIMEVLMSCVVLAIMMGGLFNCFGFGFFLTGLVRENQRASQIILEKVEILRLYNWDQVNTPGFIPKSFTDVYDPQNPDNPGISYTGTLEIQDYPTGNGTPNYSANIKQFIVTLSWTSAGKIPHTRKLATLIAKNGEQNYVY